MMRPTKLALVALAVACDGVRASDFAADPFTPGGDVLMLDRTHPALGAAPPADSLSFAVVAADADALVDRGDGGNLSFSFASESREATSKTDLERLEKHFKTKMVVNYEELRKFAKGEAEVSPWPSGYWATHLDGINFAWNANDNMPPSEKYARAFGLRVDDFTKKITETTGIQSQAKTRPSCKNDGDCARLKDGSTCAKRDGQSKGFCVPTWYGICHAWAPAAILEREPRCAVTKSGVNFEPFDIKALITQVYDGSNLGTVFTGTRYNGAESTDSNLDKDGRYKDSTRRDLGAGLFHIALTNIMGKRSQSFVIDVDAGPQVWNQPVRRYEVLTETELTPEQTAREFFAPRTSYPFNGAAKKTVFVQTRLDYIGEANENGALVSSGKVDAYTTAMYLEYVLELDSKGNVVGGEWVRESKKFHPDFLWLPEAPLKDNTVAKVGIKYKDVRELLDASADCKPLRS